MNLVTTLMSRFSGIISLPHLLSVQGGLTSAKNEVLDTIKFLVNTILIPLASAFLIGMLVFNIVKAVKKHHGAEPYGENITGIIIVVVVLAVVVSSPAWIWTMISA